MVVSRDLDALQLFAGEGEITKSIEDMGLKCASHDIKYDKEEMDSTYIIHWPICKSDNATQVSFNL